MLSIELKHNNSTLSKKISKQNAIILTQEEDFRKTSIKESLTLKF